MGKFGAEARHALSFLQQHLHKSLAAGSDEDSRASIDAITNIDPSRMQQIRAEVADDPVARAALDSYLYESPGESDAADEETVI